MVSKHPKSSEKASVREVTRFPISTPKPWVAGSNPPAPAMFNGRFRSDRGKTRKAEISRDFSAFFDPNFFRVSIDPFSIFFRVEGFELPKTHFFKNFILNASNTKDLNPRQGFKFFRLFVPDTKYLQMVDYKTSPSLLQKDLNPRKAENSIFRNRSIRRTKGSELPNIK